MDLREQYIKEKGYSNFNNTVLNEYTLWLEKKITDNAQALQLLQPDVSGSLPSLDDATKVAVRISEEAITASLDAKEQALFIAGFQECIKWLNIVFSNDR